MTYGAGLATLKAEVCGHASKLRTLRRQELRFRAAGQPTQCDRTHVYRVRARPQARAALLAYGFLRGRSYDRVESGPTRTKPRWDLVFDYVRRHASVPETTWRQRLAEWLDDATLDLDMKEPWPEKIRTGSD